MHWLSYDTVTVSSYVLTISPDVVTVSSYALTISSCALTACTGYILLPFESHWLLERWDGADTIQHDQI